MTTKLEALKAAVEARYGRLVERVYAGARRGGYIDEDGQKALRELYDAAKRLLPLYWRVSDHDYGSR